MVATRFTNLAAQCGAGERHDDSQNARHHARRRGLSRRGAEHPRHQLHGPVGQLRGPRHGSPCPGGESGWGITFTQHSSNQVEAVWYTYDPRQADSTSSGNFKPLWLVMPGGTWTSPTIFTGDMYVTLGTPFGQAWGFGGTTIPRFPSRRWARSRSRSRAAASARSSTTSRRPPATSPTATIPAFGLPSFSGTKPICRNSAF